MRIPRPTHYGKISNPPPLSARPLLRLPFGLESKSLLVHDFRSILEVETDKRVRVMKAKGTKRGLTARPEQAFALDRRQRERS